eukprot:5050920-Pyramimonas_sp.AAC.1
MAGGITPSPPAAGGCGRRMTRTAPPRTGASSQEDGDESQWTHLPEYIVSGIFEQLRWERKASATFRLVCTSWLKLHDGLLRAIRVRAAIMPTGMTPSPWRKFEGHVTSLDCRRVFETVTDEWLASIPYALLGSLKTLDMSSCFRVKHGLALAALQKLEYLNLS